MVENTEVQEILVEEIEQLLDETVPNEADSAMLYVDSPAEFEGKTSDEKAFGIPGSGFAILVGPLLLHFVVEIATAFLKEASKQGVETATKLSIDYLKKKFKASEKAEAGTKQETITAITTALIKAGWNAGKAGEAAEKVWSSGIKTGQRLYGNSMNK